MVTGEPLLQAILAAIDEGIHVVDSQGVTVFYNEAAARSEGLAPAEVEGRPLLEVFPSLTRDTSTLLQVLAVHRPILNRQQTFTNFKGDRVTTVNSTYPIWVDGAFAGAIEVAKDITRVRELAEAVLDLRAALLSPRRRPRGDGPLHTFADLIGASPRFQRVVEQARRAAASRLPVLVWGETGTGKELLVQAIHNAGPRATRPFIAQNCTALPQGLLESILFGTVRGAFTGAEDRPGLFELADGGSLFLDEINSMPLDLQAKLLRVLQDGRVRRVGDRRERTVDVRILAASGEDPLAVVAAGRMRRDLFYRINVVVLELPPLRERRDDLDCLCTHFRRRHGGAAAPPLSPAVRSRFFAYGWPGNVRELEHAIEAGLQFCRGNQIELTDLPPHLRGPAEPAATGLGGTGGPAPVPASAPASTSASAPASAPVSDGVAPPPGGPGLRRFMREKEREILAAALRDAGGNVALAARRLGLPRQTLRYRLQRAGLAAGAGRRAP